VAAIDSTYGVRLPRLGRLPRGRPIMWVLVAAPVWWLMGLSAFVWIGVGLVLLLGQLVNRDVRFPQRFGFWALFLAWTMLSAVGIDFGGGEAITFILRELTYLGATGFFLYIYNARRDGLPDYAVVNMLALYWAAIALGGLIGIAFPNLGYTSPVAQILPSNPYINDVVQVQFAQVHEFLGFPVGRPSTLFRYTNQWGSAFALLVPFAFAAAGQVNSVMARRALQALIALSIIPVVVSLNRGLWLALGVATAYIGLRAALALRFRLLGGVVAVAALAAIVVGFTSLGELASDRVETPHSDTTRMAIYDETFTRVERSPLVGYGSTEPSEIDPSLPPLGTHSQILHVAFVHGIPAALLFFGWIAATLLRSKSARSGPLFWAHVAILIFLVESVYYLMTHQILVMMIVAALIWRIPPGERQDSDRHVQTAASARELRQA